METRLGFNHTDHNLFMDTRLNVGMITVFSYDWPHIYLQGGVFNVELEALMYMLIDEDLGVPTLHVYLQRWQWPGGYAKARDICKTGSVAGSISEHASLAPVLEKYLVYVVMTKGVFPDACRSMLALIKVLSLLQRCQAAEKPTPQELHNAISEHLRRHKAVYGTRLWIPKHHFSIHLPDFLAKYGTLLNSLVLERKHKNVKQVLRERTTMQSYEHSVMEDLVVMQLEALSHPLVSSSLAKPRAPSKKMTELLNGALGVARGPFQTASKCFVRNRAVKLRDVVCYEDTAGHLCVGQVEFICKAGEDMHLCVNAWDFHDRPRDSVVRYTVRGAPLLLGSSFVQESLVFLKANSCEISQVLVSPHLRRCVFD